MPDTYTHTLRAANMRVGHVRGVQPVPVTLCDCAPDCDDARETAEVAMRDAVRGVLPLARTITVRWRPSSTTADVYVRGANASFPAHKAATFTVRATGAR